MWNIFKRRTRQNGVRSAQILQKDPIYVSRGTLEADLKKLISRNENIVVYGPSGQGKTMLLGAVLPLEQNIYIECRPDFKRTHLYRLILSHLGYSISVGGKKKLGIKYGAKASFVGSTLSGELQAADENNLQNINVDLRNPSEVAHLISRLKKTPYVILNGFDNLKDGTKENMLLDICFFKEISDIRFIIVGSWYNQDNLELLEPTISGRVNYLSVPFWTDDDLLWAYNHWKPHLIAGNLNSDNLSEALTLCNGDVSLFRAIVSMAHLSETAAAFREQVEQVVVSRSRRWLERRIETLLWRRELSVSYEHIVPRWVGYPNPAYKEPESQTAAKNWISVDPATGKPFRAFRATYIDADGNVQQKERIATEISEESASLGAFIFRKLFQAVHEGRDYVNLADLSSVAQAELLQTPYPIETRKLEAVFDQIADIQRKAYIFPSLITVDEGALKIADRRLFLLFKNFEDDEFDEWLVELAPVRAPSPRRNAQISKTLTIPEMNKLRARVRAMGRRATEQSTIDDEDEDFDTDADEDEDTDQDADKFDSWTDGNGGGDAVAGAE